MKKKISKIPTFKNREEEAHFWDTHSLADYWSEFKNVNLMVELHKPKNDTVIVRLQKGLKDELQKAARSRGLNISALARMWLMERLQSGRA